MLCIAIGTFLYISRLAAFCFISRYFLLLRVIVRFDNKFIALITYICNMYATVNTVAMHRYLSSRVLSAILFAAIRSASRGNIAL